MRKEDYKAFLDMDLGPYSGEWVAILRGKVLSHNKKFKVVFEDAQKKYPDKKPQFMMVPEKGKWIFYNGS